MSMIPTAKDLQVALEELRGANARHHALGHQEIAESLARVHAWLSLEAVRRDREGLARTPWQLLAAEPADLGLIDGGCEWLPDLRRARRAADKAHAPAELVVAGWTEPWYLCRACADLQRFEKHWNRKPLQRCSECGLMQSPEGKCPCALAKPS